MGSHDPRNVCTVSSSYPLSPFLFYFSLSSLPLLPPSPPSLSRWLSARKNSLFRQKRKCQPRPLLRPRLHPPPLPSLPTPLPRPPARSSSGGRSARSVGGSVRGRWVGQTRRTGGLWGEERGRGRMGRRSQGTTWSFMTPTLNYQVQYWTVYVCHRQSENCRQKLANWILYIHV